VNVYLDTNIVVADAVEAHEDHTRAVSLIQEAQRRRWTLFISAHGLAESYAVLTGTPFSHSVSPAEAWLILQENVFQLFEIQSLSRTDYTEVIRNCAAQGWSGGAIFDALHLQAARKANCTRIYTFAVQDFRRIAPDLGDRILSP
jgi:predicted nucleic acid-binding protein